MLLTIILIIGFVCAIGFKYFFDVELTLTEIIILTFIFSIVIVLIGNT